MVTKGTFTDKDAENLVEFLNLLSNKAEFNGMTIKDNIRLFGLLSWAQQSLLEKIKANLLEVVKVEQIKPDEKSKGKAKS